MTQPPIVSVHELSRADARRIAVRAQLLDGRRPTDADMLDVVRHLTFVQNDPTTAVAPNADLVLWSRLGSAYEPVELQQELERQQLIELHMMVRPREDLRLFTAEMAAWPGPGELRDWQEHNEGWVATNEQCRLDILERLRMDGPLLARELPDSCSVPWRSSGWTNNQNVMKMLDFLVARGEVATAGRESRERLWDLAERVYPDEPRRRGGRARRRRRRPRTVAGRPRAARQALPRAGGAAVAAGSAGVRPEADDRDLRVRLPARDVQAGGKASPPCLAGSGPGGSSGDVGDDRGELPRA